MKYGNNSIQYTAEYLRHGEGQEPITITLSRPLDRNMLLFASSKKAIITPVYPWDKEGKLREGYPPDNQNADIIAYAWIDYRSNSLSFQTGERAFNFIPLDKFN